LARLAISQKFSLITFDESSDVLLRRNDSLEEHLIPAPPAAGTTIGLLVAHKLDRNQHIDKSLGELGKGLTDQEAAIRD